MKAIILAAGKSTRLLPLTKDKHQCMLKVGGKTILEKQLNLLKGAGVEDITVVTGYQSVEVEELCKRLEIKTLFNPFYGVSGMALTLWVAKEELRNGFIFLYSDVLFDSGIIKGLLEVKGDICLAIKKNSLREEAEKVIETEGTIKGVTKLDDAEGNGEFIGIAKLSPAGAEKLIWELNIIAKANLNSSFIGSVDSLIKKGETVTAFDIKDAQFIDMDFPEDLEKAEALFS